MKYLGIDYGLAYLGLSVGDDESRVAVPMDTIRETDLKRQAITIEQIVADEEIDAVVVGNPLTLDGEEQDQAERTLAFINELSGRISVDIHREDERFSSGFAQRQKMEDPDGKFDEHALAAAFILQSFLDRQ
jgi:putative Holliday junction resolvase